MHIILIIFKVIDFIVIVKILVHAVKLSHVFTSMLSYVFLASTVMIIIL